MKTIDTPEQIADLVLQSLCKQIMDHDEVAGAIAETNAWGWGLDTYDVESVTRLGDSLHFEATIYLTGDQSEDHSPNGDALNVTVSGIANHDGEDWQTESYVVTAIKSNVDDDLDD